ncbi:MAG TPA: hypothetical protein VLJ37_06435 [bacterium]|nr:hypothetical protein [bacterium]
MHPSIVSFPLTAAVGLPIAVDVLVRMAPDVSDRIVDGEVGRLRAVLDGLSLPRSLHAPALVEFAVSLSFSQRMLFSEEKVQDLLGRMRSPLYHIRGEAPEEKTHWGPLLPEAPNHYTGQWIGDASSPAMADFLLEKNESRWLAKDYYGFLRRRIVELKADFEGLRWAFDSEKDTHVRVRLSRATDSAIYNGTRLDHAASQICRAFGFRVLIHESWMNFDWLADIEAKGSRGELMSRSQFEQVLQYVDCKRKLYSL